MPTYGYECKNCKHSFDVFQSMKDEPIKTCPECGKEVRRLINGGSGVIFKGSGFYVNDKSGKTANGKTAGSNTAAEIPKADKACQGCPMASGSSKGAEPVCPKAANG